jgi:hypothetical protein
MHPHLASPLSAKAQAGIKGEEFLFINYHSVWKNFVLL